MSFQFLHKAQEVLEQKKFYRLVKHLVEYDKGSIEVNDRRGARRREGEKKRGAFLMCSLRLLLSPQIPTLVQTAADCLAAQAELQALFVAFLPDKAKPMLAKLLNAQAR
jgi:hypothetical protein